MKEKWRLINLGPTDGLTIQNVYEAVAWSISKGLAPNTIILCYPKHPYVCIGVHQIAELELDIDYCKSQNIPIIRRQVGGGAVYLDSNQQFYHVIIHMSHPLTRKSIEDFYREILQAIVNFYRSYNLPAKYKPINDVVIRNRKASGNGAARLYDSMVLIGNVILDFDAEKAARILRIPEEKFRDKIIKSISEWIMSLKRELGYIPPRKEIIERLKRSFEETLGIELIEGKLLEEEKVMLRNLIKERSSYEWYAGQAIGREDILKRYSEGERIIKIHEKHYILFIDHRGIKTLRMVIEIYDNIIKDVVISGDFFVQPLESLSILSKSLKGLNINDIDYIKSKIIEEFNKYVKLSAGLKAEDIINAIERARRILEIRT